MSLLSIIQNLPKAPEQNPTSKKCGLHGLHGLQTPNQLNVKGDFCNPNMKPAGYTGYKTADDYDTAEREAIQEESELPPFTAEELDLRVSGLDDLPDIPLAEHGRLALEAAQAKAPAPRPSPEQVQCCDCQHFRPIDISQGEPAFGIGSCSITGTHMTPGKQACWPRVKRRCTHFQPTNEDKL